MASLFYIPIILLMKNFINIQGNGQVFKYLLEYLNTGDSIGVQDIKWNKNYKEIQLFTDNIKHYRIKNEYYHRQSVVNNIDYIPDYTDISTIRIYFPSHSVDTYGKNIKYAINVNTWINGYYINLGTKIVRRLDALASDSIIKSGEISYYEYVDMQIIDPYQITYSDNWEQFRKNICDEPTKLNNTGSLLNISIYIVEDYEDKYILKDDYVGGYTSFNISKSLDEFMSLKLDKSLDPLGWKLNLSINSEYDWFLTYLQETYGLTLSHKDITYELVLKSNDAIIPGPTINYEKFEQLITWDYIKNFKNSLNNIDRTGFYEVFNSWNNFEEGWFIQASLNIVQDDYEILSVISNKVPLTQEIFKYYISDSKKIIDISEMEINNYTVINKIENKIVQLERPDNSKSNIIQPVFFKVKDTEKLTIHPAVTENICINLDDYKSKVKSFKLQIENKVFEQIGVNQYGVLFKIVGSLLPNEIKTGTYYILNEDNILVTTGKYNYAQ